MSGVSAVTPKQRKAATVDPDHMPVVAPEGDRPRCFDRVEVFGCGREAVIVELRRLEPVVGTALLLGEGLSASMVALTRARLHLAPLSAPVIGWMWVSI